MIDIYAPWHQLPLAVIDFETTGVDPQECMPVSVAVVRYEGGQEADHFYSLLNPGIPIPEGATEIHGISDADVKGAPPILDVDLEIGRVADDCVPVAYNATYDSQIMHRLLAGALPHTPVFDLRYAWIDPLVMIRKIDKFVGGKGRHKLTTTCERWGIDLTDAHNALGDARATGALLLCPQMRKQLGDMTYGELIRRQRDHAATQNAEFEAWKARQPPQEATS